MIVFLRAIAAFVVGSIVASAALASSPMDAVFNAPNDAQAYSPPSVTASSPITQDYAVRLASADEPVAYDAAASEPADQNSCGCGNACSQYTCCCSPRWYVSAGTTIMHRDATGGTIVGNNPFTGVPFSRGTDFNYDWEGGPDITIGHRLWQRRYYRGPLL
jgi:hypothetical protein